MKRGLAPIALLILLPPLMFMAASCGQGNTQTQSATQPDIQPVAEEQARQTVADFLEMCKQGQVKKAVDTYGAEHLQLRLYPPPVISIYPPGLNDLVDYTVEGVASIQQNSSIVLGVEAALSCNSAITKEIHTTICIFQLTKDGKFILYNDPTIKLSPGDRAKLTVAGFLEMCKQGQYEEAVNKYVLNVATVPEEPNPWTDFPEFDEVVSYNTSDASFGDFDSRAAATIQTRDGAVNFVFGCNQDGIKLESVVEIQNGDQVKGEGI